MPKLIVATLALIFAAPASADLMTLYTNGMVENYSGYPVAGSNHVTDSFTLPPYSHILEIDLLVFGPDLLIPPPTVDWAITGTPLGGPVYDSGTSDLTYSLLDSISTPPFQTDMVLLTFNPDVMLDAGNYWLDLSNIHNLFIDGPNNVKWANSGGSSSAVSSTDGPVPSQSFEILGTTPEPGSTALVGGGLILGAFFLRRKRAGAPVFRCGHGDEPAGQLR